MSKRVNISIKDQNLPEWEKFTKSVENVSETIVKLVKIYQFEGFPTINRFDEIKKFYRIYNAWKNAEPKEETGNDKPVEMVENGKDYNILYELKDIEFDYIND
jgi:ribosomal protein L20A (L18A)